MPVPRRLASMSSWEPGLHQGGQWARPRKMGIAFCCNLQLF